MAKIVDKYRPKPIGLRNLVFFPLTKDDTEGATYGDPVFMSRAIKVTLTPTSASGDLNADDAVEDLVKMNTGYEVTLDAAQLSDDVRAAVFGHKQDAKGGLLSTASDIAVQGAFAFRVPLTDGGWAYRVLYKGVFEEFEETFETAKSGEIAIQTHNGIKGTFGPRTYDNAVSYSLRSDSEGFDAEIGKKWFQAVQEPPKEL